MAQGADTGFGEVVINADEFKPTAPAKGTWENPSGHLPNRSFSLTGSTCGRAEYRLVGNIHDS
jgi:hypothetical protein